MNEWMNEILALWSWNCLGPSVSNEDVGTESHGTGDHRPDQQHRQERLHLLPRVLQGHPREVQTRRRGGFKPKHVQGEDVKKFCC